MSSPTNKNRPPRIPTWLVVTLSIALIAGAIYLFVGDLGSSSETDDSKASKAGGSKIDERDSLDTLEIGESAEDDTEPDEEDPELDELPPLFDSLDGVTIAIDPAFGGAPNDIEADETTQIAGKSSPCFRPGVSTAGISEAAIALAVAIETQEILTRAGARVTLVREGENAECIDTRIRARSAKQVGVIIAANTPKGGWRISSAVDAGEESDAVVRGLQQAFRALESPRESQRSETLEPIRARIVGAFARPKGSNVVVVDLGQLTHSADRRVLADSATQSQIAMAIATGIANWQVAQ